MKIIISIFIILAVLYFYKKYAERKSNKLIQNLEEFAKKEKIKQQKSKILERKVIKRTSNKRKKVYG